MARSDVEQATVPPSPSPRKPDSSRSLAVRLPKSLIFWKKQTDGSASFLRAARAGNLEKVLEFLKAETDINTCNANGLNALHLSSKEGHAHVVAALLERNASVDSSTKKGNTALHIASLAGQEDIVKILVDHGASVNIQSQNGFTPLYMAAQENHDSVVRFLLAHGANQSFATEDGFTPLAVALQQGHDKVVAVLLENDTRGKVRLPALHIAAKKDDTKAAALLLHTDHNPDVTSKSGFTPLHIASHYGNESIAALLIQRGADVNYVAKHQITPLHVASKWGKGNMVSLLVDRGANIEAKTRDGLTPLHCAARSGHETVVDLLLEKGAPITAKTKNGLAPLHMASQGDHVDAARILLYHKAPVDDVTVDFLTALHVAAHCGHVRVAKLLLDRKADPNSRALNGFTPLHIACKKNRIKVVELLLKNGASIEATTESGLTPLHVASFMGCMNIVIYLIQHGCSVDVPTVRGETPLHLAARANQADIIRILLRNGAQVDARAREQQTALHIASRLGNSDIALLLLQHGATVDAATKDRYTPLHIACKEGQEDVCNVLLDQGASMAEVTKKGFTPLHLASKYGQLKVAKLLLQRDSPVDAQGKNNVTPLHVAAHYDHQNVALLLLEKGASPHATAKNGYTPLHIAARKNQMDIAGTLLEYGAEAKAESRAGFTPLHLAAQEGHSEMSSLLIEHKADAGAHARNGLTPLHLAAQEDKVGVAAILVKNGSAIDPETKAGYTPLHVACHFGQMNMVRFLLQHGARVDAPTQLGYTPLHQAAQQGHTQIVNLLLENKAEPNMETKDGKTALSIAQKLGYISVVETLKIVTETKVTTNTTTVTEEKYKVVVPETMHETFLSESEDEGGDDTMLGEQSYRFLTVDEMKSLGDDSMPIDDKMDVSFQSTTAAAPLHPTGDHSPQHTRDGFIYPTDNVDVSRAPVLAGPESLNTTVDTSFNASIAIDEPMPLDPTVRSVPEAASTVTAANLNRSVDTGTPESIDGWEQFLVSFMVDARGGAMRGCRHSGVRVIIPPRKAAMPMRITCRYLKKDKLVHAPPLMEGEALASRILEMGPSSAKFLGPVIMEVPHFASLRGKEREIVILRSDNGETWREHTLEATEEAVQEVLNESFDGEDLRQLEDLNTCRITRILTTDFPQYFAIVTRIRQEVHAIGPEGGMVSSTVVPQVQAVFPQGALTKKIKVGLQAQPISPELVAKLLGNRVAVSPIVTVEPRRRKFHKPITLTIPVPQAASKGMINQYSGEAPTLRLLCSITGGTTRAQWEDVTGSTPLTFVNDCVSFTTTVSARFWLMDCTNIPEATKMATELYREAIHVPFMSKFVVFSKRHQTEEARVRVFCMTDDKEDKTLETQEHFVEVAKSRDVEVLEGKTQFLEFGGNLVPITKSGEQLAFNFYAFRENRLPFTVRVKDTNAEPVGRVAFMRQPKVGRGEPPQNPICNLNLSLPENVQPELAPSEPDLLSLERKYAFLSISKADTIHKADLRLSDISNMLSNDWVSLAKELGLNESDINMIMSQYPNNAPQQAIVMLRLWMQTAGNQATGNALEKGLRKIDREDIVNRCIFNVELVTDDQEKHIAETQLEAQKREAALSVSKEKDLMKESESADEEEIIRKDTKESRRGDLSPTYETEERKYAGEEKIISETRTVHKETSSKESSVEYKESFSKKGPITTENVSHKEDHISKDDSHHGEEKYVFETRSREDGAKETTEILSQESQDKMQEGSQQSTLEKFAVDDGTNRFEEGKSSVMSAESKIDSLSSEYKVSHSVEKPQEVDEVMTSVKRTVPADADTKTPEQKTELLQKLGEELSLLDEKLDEKFRDSQPSKIQDEPEAVEETCIVTPRTPTSQITSQVIVESFSEPVHTHMVEPEVEDNQIAKEFQVTDLSPLPQSEPFDERLKTDLPEQISLPETAEDSLHLSTEATHGSPSDQPDILEYQSSQPESGSYDRVADPINEDEPLEKSAVDQQFSDYRVESPNHRRDFQASEPERTTDLSTVDPTDEVQESVERDREDPELSDYKVESPQSVERPRSEIRTSESSSSSDEEDHAIEASPRAVSPAVESPDEAWEVVDPVEESYDPMEKQTMKLEEQPQSLESQYSEKSSEDIPPQVSESSGGFEPQSLDQMQPQLSEDLEPQPMEPVGPVIEETESEFVDPNDPNRRIIKKTKIITSQEMTPEEMESFLRDNKLTMEPQFSEDLIPEGFKPMKSASVTTTTRRVITSSDNGEPQAREIITVTKDEDGNVITSTSTGDDVDIPEILQRFEEIEMPGEFLPTKTETLTTTTKQVIKTSSDSSEPEVQEFVTVTKNEDGIVTTTTSVTGDTETPLHPTSVEFQLLEGMEPTTRETVTTTTRKILTSADDSDGEEVQKIVTVTKGDDGTVTTTTTISDDADEFQIPEGFEPSAQQTVTTTTTKIVQSSDPLSSTMQEVTTVTKDQDGIVTKTVSVSGGAELETVTQEGTTSDEDSSQSSLEPKGIDLEKVSAPIQSTPVSRESPIKDEPPPAVDVPPPWSPDRPLYSSFLKPKNPEVEVASPVKLVSPSASCSLDTDDKIGESDTNAIGKIEIERSFELSSTLASFNKFPPTHLEENRRRISKEMEGLLAEVKLASSKLREEVRSLKKLDTPDRSIPKVISQTEPLTEDQLKRLPTILESTAETEEEVHTAKFDENGPQTLVQKRIQKLDSFLPQSKKALQRKAILKQIRKKYCNAAPSQSPDSNKIQVLSDKSTAIQPQHEKTVEDIHKAANLIDNELVPECSPSISQGKLQTSTEPLDTSSKLMDNGTQTDSKVLQPSTIFSSVVSSSYLPACSLLDVCKEVYGMILRVEGSIRTNKWDDLDVFKMVNRLNELKTMASDTA